MKSILRAKKYLFAILIMGCFWGCFKKKEEKPLSKVLTINYSKPLFTVDGFGVNINPGQWNDGKLKPALDLLVDDLGSTLFRFDCTGLANWLDPTQRLINGCWPDEYLDSVYTSEVFSNAWATFRYLNEKGIEPFFNVSGKTHPAMGKPDEPNRLADFDAYAEMIATMLEWAREKEGLKFSLLAPFNETDLGYPEGPNVDAAGMRIVTKRIVEKLDEHGLTDINIIALDDAFRNFDKLDTLLTDTSYVNRVYAFATHIYGNGNDCETDKWYESETEYAQFSKEIKASPFKNSSVWITEYGDLDQTGEIEFEFSWRSTRRIMKCFRDGFNAGVVWDAFDNFHMHDALWTEYGLLQTDTVNWKYSPRKRYYAAKQIFRYVKPGWKMVGISTPFSDEHGVLEKYYDSFRHIRTLAFVSPDGTDFTLVVMNGIESPVNLSINMEEFGSEITSKPVHLFVTDMEDNCAPNGVSRFKGKTVNAMLPVRSISTVTTLNEK